MFTWGNLKDLNYWNIMFGMVYINEYNFVFGKRQVDIIFGIIRKKAKMLLQMIWVFDSLLRS